MLGAQAGDEENTVQEPLLNETSDGNIGSVERTLDTEEGEQQDENLPDVPLEPFKTHVKFCFHWSKWIFLLMIFDISMSIIVTDEYGRKNPSLRPVLALVLILNTVVAFLSARAIDRDVAKVDERVQSEGGNGSENPLVYYNDYENIYGKAAREFDLWLASTCKVNPGNTVERPTGTTSFVSHMFWIMWAFLFASAVSVTIEIGLEKVSLVAHNQTDLAKGVDDTSNTDSISHFPSDLQRWMTSYEWERNEKFSFPTERRYYSSLEPLALDDRMFLLKADRLTEFVAVDNHLVKRVHSDIRRPEISVAVESSLHGENREQAGQYCFVVSNYAACDQRVHCTDPSKMKNGNALVLKNATLEFQGTNYHSKNLNDYEAHKLAARNCNLYEAPEAASYQDLVFVSRASYRPRCREVIQLDTTTMETSTIFNVCLDLDDHNEFVPSSRSLTINGLIGLILASIYMIASLGMASGFFPLMSALFYVLNLLTHGQFAFLFLAIGTIFFHYSIFTDRKWRYIPSWVRKDAYIGSLYGWICATTISNVLLFVPVSFSRYVDDGWVIFCIFVTGIILGHPILQGVGYTMLAGFFVAFITEFQWILMSPGDFVQQVLTALGLILLGNWLTANKEVMYAKSQYVLWYLSKWFRTRFRLNLRRRT